jgi:hypothetical protein
MNTERPMSESIPDGCAKKSDVFVIGAGFSRAIDEAMPLTSSLT